MKEKQDFFTFETYEISNYQSQIENFYSNINNIRKAFGLDTISTKLQCNSNFFYNKYLSDNCFIETSLKASIIKNEETLVVADTGSGKTYTFFNLTNDDEWNIGIFPFWSITDHNSNKYSIERICGGDHADFEIKDVEIIDNDWVVDNKKEIIGNKRFATLMDKVDELQKYFEELEINGLNLKEQKGIVWVDEAHLLVNSTFRRNAVAKVLKFLDFVREKTGITIFYTTATPFNCHLLPITQITFFDKKKEVSNVKEIKEFVCNSDQNINDMIITHLKRAINNNKKVILRVNNINFIKNIEQQFDKVDYITGENKGESKLFKKISEESTLDMSETNILCLTCVLDAGVSIDKIVGCDVKDIENIFILDKNIDMNELKQFSNRLRFDTTLTLITDKHDYIPEEWDILVSFANMVKKDGVKYGEFWKNFQKINEAYKFIYQNEKQRSEELQRILLQKNFLDERNNFNNVFYIEDNEIKYNYFLAYNRIWDEYQKQFFYSDRLRHQYLKDTFLVDDIKSEEVQYNDKYVDIIEEKVDDILEKVKTDKELQFAIKKNDTKEIKKVLYENYNIENSNLLLEHKKFDKLKELSKYESVGDAANSILTESNIEIGKKIKEYERQQLTKLSDNELDEIISYIKDKNFENIKSTLVMRVIDTEYFHIYEDAFSVNINLKDLQKIIVESGISKAKYYIKEETVIKFNKDIDKRQHWKGQAQFQQYSLISIVETYRNAKSINMNDKIIKEITQKMGKKTKTKWNTKDVREFIKMVYSCSENKENIIVNGLRKQHSHQ